MRKKTVFFLTVTLTLCSIFVTAILVGAINVDRFSDNHSYIASIDTDPTGYGITLQMLGNQYTEFVEMTTIDGIWRFHFTKTPLGKEQRNNFADMLEAVHKVDSRYFATSNTIYKCSPTYISQIDKFVLTCDELL